MVIHMADDLPEALTGGVHVQRRHDPVVEAFNSHIVALKLEPVAMHMEDMAGSSVC